jgi:hypothetical protein
MMRRSMTTLTLVAVCGSLALLAAGTVALAITLGARARAARATGTRSWVTTLSPVPDELALAQITFPAVARRRLSRQTLHVAVSGPFGDDYVAWVAVARALTPGVARALVALVNRPSLLDDPTHVRLRISAQRSLGAPVVRTLADPFARSASAPRPALCDLPLHGGALAGSQLRALGSRGSPLAGFDAASTVAQAYDAACGLSFESAFERAVAPSSGGGSTPPASPAPTPTPEPGPPVGRLPGEGCEPRPGYACPQAGSVGSRSGARPERRVPMGSY